MKRKTIFLLIITFIFIFMVSMPVDVFAGDKPSVDHSFEYAQFGITKKNAAYYYQNKRIRIFFDERADHSFEYSFIDINGIIDVRLLRNKAGNVCSLKLISKKKANKILKDMIGFVPKHSAVNATKSKQREYTDINRCQIKDIPSDIKKAIAKKCTKNKWYVIKSSDRKYIYLKKSPKDFAYQIVGKNVNIRDIGKKKKSGSVLLSVGGNFKFTLSYNSKQVKYTVIRVK